MTSGGCDKLNECTECHKPIKSAWKVDGESYCLDCYERIADEQAKVISYLERVRAKLLARISTLEASCVVTISNKDNSNE